MSATRIYVPRDAAARSVGSDATAAAILEQAKTRGIDIELVRNGSRGLLWLEPLVEVATAAGRVAYGPVRAQDVESLFDAGFASGKPHALGHGITEQIPYFKSQERLTFARVGITDPISIEDYIAHEGYRGLKAALGMEPAAIVAAITASGLRGRGGAAFPAGIKWKTVLATSADQKYIVCNADEGDSGTFSDRMVIEGDPFVLIEGMTIAGLATGGPSPQLTSIIISGITFAAAASVLISRYAWAQALTSAVRRPPCSSPWRVSGVRFASNRRCPRSKACSANPP
jgi:formate dehydrogenase iron-sulfur subunit